MKFPLQMPRNCFFTPGTVNLCGFIFESVDIFILTASNTANRLSK